MSLVTRLEEILRNHRTNKQAQWLQDFHSKLDLGYLDKITRLSTAHPDRQTELAEWAEMFHKKMFSEE